MNITRWVMLVAVILMLAAMGMYVLTDNESIEPGGGPNTVIGAPVEAM